MRLIDVIAQAAAQQSSINPWIPVGISCMGVLGVVFLLLDRFRKRDPELIDRAMKMVELADKQADEVREELAAAKITISNLNFQLSEANNSLTTVNRELKEAQGEVIFLRGQIRIMTDRVERENKNG